MKKSIKIEVPEGETPKLVNVGDDGWRVEFEEAKPEIEIGSWWVAPNLIPARAKNGPFQVVKYDRMRSYIEYLDGEKDAWIMPDEKNIFPIPPKPDEDELKKEGYELTGEARVPQKGDYYVTSDNKEVACAMGENIINPTFGRRRWIVRKITKKGLDLLKTLIPGDYVAINGVGVLVSGDDGDIRFTPSNEAVDWMTLEDDDENRCDLERAISMNIDDITEDKIEWRWKAPR
jgi:hypothetical protein